MTMCGSSTDKKRSVVVVLRNGSGSIASKRHEKRWDDDETYLFGRRKPSHYTLVQKTVHLSIFHCFLDKNSQNYLKREATEPRKLMFRFGLVNWKGKPPEPGKVFQR